MPQFLECYFCFVFAIPEHEGVAGAQVWSGVRSSLSDMVSCSLVGLDSLHGYRHTVRLDSD